jgi:hypothetical protein
MNHGTLILILGGVFLALLGLSVLVWAVWVRPYAKRTGARTGSPFSLATLVTDFSTGLLYSRGQLPFPLKLFGLLLILMASDLLFIVLLFLFGA